MCSLYGWPEEKKRDEMAASRIQLRRTIFLQLVGFDGIDGLGGDGWCCRLLDGVLGFVSD